MSSWQNIAHWEVNYILITYYFTVMYSGVECHGQVTDVVKYVLPPILRRRCRDMRRIF